MVLSLALLTGGREYVLEQLASDPAWQRVRIKSPEGAASVLVEIAKRIALDEARALILPEIQGWYRGYVKKNGSPPLDTASDWYEGHDDGLMNLFEAFTSYLSASWLAYASTDIQLWNENEDEKLATNFANEVWKQLTWKRTTNQILASIGIVHDDLAQFGYMPTEPEPAPKPEYSEMKVNSIINQIMLTMPDPTTLDDDLDFASDDDDALALGAANRLGISMEDVDVLREARARSSSVVKAWQNAIEAGEFLDDSKHYADIDPPEADDASPPWDTGPEIPTSLRRTALPPLPGTATALPPLPGSAGATKPLPPLPVMQGTSQEPPVNRGRGGRRTKTPDEPPAGYIPLEVLRSIKEHAGTKDEDMADLLGISRPTLANVMKGKGWYVPPDPTRRAAIRAMLDKHAKALMRAHDAI